MARQEDGEFVVLRNILSKIKSSNFIKRLFLKNSLRELTGWSLEEAEHRLDQYNKEQKGFKVQTGNQ
ncbi:MAG: hypothetical protein RI935_53 [Candidatus Parcubacteria bacterium]